MMSKTREQRLGSVSARLRSWAAMVTLLVLVGVVGSVVGARVEARNDSLKLRQTSFGTSTAIASKLELALQHEQDLVVTAAAFIAGNPEATQAQFGRAMTSISAFQRYPELQGIAKLVLVPSIPAERIRQGEGRRRNL